MSLSRRSLSLILALLIAFGGAGQLLAAQRLVPNRLSSTGDSITEAIDAELPLANHWESWANGYTNFWTWLLGLYNANSHNQRISKAFGSKNRTNYVRAKSGADSYDFPGQAAQAVADRATYVPLLMGHNDVCQDRFDQIPTDAEFEGNIRAGLETLRTGLAAGSTIYIVGMVDIYKLWELGDELTALGLIDCRLIWVTTLLELFPCGTMLSPLNSEADRQYTRGRNIAFNNILRDLVEEYSANDPNHYYSYTDTVFDTSFIADDVSFIDCFHPSGLGQKKLSHKTWNDGPFAGF